jgi:hypothetical protein
MSDNSADESVERRAVLKRIGATGAVLAGASGSASAASSEGVGVTNESVAPGRVKAAIQQHANGVLRTLADEGVLDTPSVAEFDLRGRDLGDLVEGDTGAAAVTFDRASGSERTFVVSQTLDAGTLLLFVDRDDGTAYATLRAGESRTVYHPEFGTYDVEDGGQVGTLGCSNECLDQTCSNFVSNQLALKANVPFLGCSTYDIVCGC